jgi:hypothetical protein
MGHIIALKFLFFVFAAIQFIFIFRPWAFRFYLFGTGTARNLPFHKMIASKSRPSGIIRGSGQLFCKIFGGIFKLISG